MLIWVCALHCEAKPVIDRYRLKKSPRAHAFDLYYGDDMLAVVSGVGKLASNAACAWSAAHHAEQASLAWINLGIAGAATHAIGSIFSLHQVIDAEDGQRYYPAPASAGRLPGSACMTLAQPGMDYSEDYLFDMEASGFMSASLRFSSAELVQAYKVVSDNHETGIGRDRARVSELIAAQIDRVDEEAHALLALDREMAARQPPADSWDQLMSLSRFSVTQQNRLRVLWRYLHNRNFDLDRLLEQLAGQPAGAIVEKLEQHSQQDGMGL